MAEFKATTEFYLAFSALFVITLAASLSSTSLSIALPTIAQSLGLTTTQAFWLGTSAAIASTVVQPSCASFADLAGRKGALAAATVFLAGGSVVTAAAQGFAVMLVGRCLQGLGMGAVTAVTEIIVVEMVPLRLRGKWLALISISWAFGTVAGPVLGGLGAQENSWTWRLIFACTAPVAVIGLILSLWTLKLPNEHKVDSTRSALKRFDWVGFLLLTASLVLLLVAILQGRVVYPWDDVRTIVPLCIGSVGLVCFVAYEMTLAAHPIIPLAIFANRSAAITFLLTALHGLLLWLALYYIPLYYEAVKLFTPLEAALAVLPETASLVPASAITGIAITWTGRYRPYIWVGWLITTGGLFSLRYLDVSSPTSEWVGLNLIFGIGTGMLFGSMGFAVQASVASETLAVAVSMFSFFRSLGAALGLAVGGAIFQNVLTTQISNHGGGDSTPSDLVQDSVALASFLRTMPESALKSILIDSVAASLQSLWLDACIISAIGLVFSFFVAHYSLDETKEELETVREDDSLATKEEV